jgi:YHS domain-containing protein
MRTYVTTPLLAGALALGLATTAFAATGQFKDMCAWGLANHKEVHTDCSVSANYDGKTYCFSSEQAKADFMKSPKQNLAKAQAGYKSLEGKS